MPRHVMIGDRSRRTVPVVLLGSLLALTACGPSARVVEEVGARKAAAVAAGGSSAGAGGVAAPAPGAGGSGTGGASAGTSSSVSAGGAATEGGSAGAGPTGTSGNSGSSSQTGTGDAEVPGDAGGRDVQADGADAAPEPAGGATDTGVTADTIKIGSVFFNGGFLDKYSQVSEQATRAWINLVNQQGGVNGRQIELISCDSRGTVNGTQACVRKLVEQDKVFMMGPSLDFAMGTVVPFIEEQGVPWVGSAGLEDPEFESEFMFPTQLRGGHVGTMTATFAVRELGGATIGVSYLQNGAGPSCLAAVKQTAQQLGGSVVAEAVNGDTETDLSGQVTRIRDANPDTVIFCNDPVNIIKFIQAADRQNYEPPVGWIGGFAAADDVPQAIGPAAVGMYAFTGYDFYGADTPGANEYRAVVSNFYPNTFFHFYSQANYVGSRVMVKAIAEVGPNLTRERVLEVLRSYTNYDTGMGLILDFSNIGGGTPSGVFLQATEDLQWVQATDRIRGAS